MGLKPSGMGLSPGSMGLKPGGMGLSLVPEELQYFPFKYCQLWSCSLLSRHSGKQKGLHNVQ